MKIKTMIGAVALLTTVGINHAFAGFFFFPPPPAVPEFDGSSSIAVIALLASVAAILTRARSKT